MTDTKDFISGHFPGNPGLARALSDGYRALSEGMTSADAGLGRYLRSFDSVLGNPGKTTEGYGEPMAMDIFFNRHAREVADVLSAYIASRESGREAIVSRVKDAVDNGDAGSGVPCDDFAATRIVETLDGADIAGVDKAEACCRKGGGIYRVLEGLLGDSGVYCLFRHLEHAWQGSAGADARNMYMSTDARKSRVLNQWLLHWTRPDAAMSIARNGFDRGNTIGDLAYNRLDGGHNYDKYHGDYLFAFAVEDNPEIPIYGSTCVMFRGSGYRIWHQGDRESQVIFDYHEPTGCFLVMPGYEMESAGVPGNEKVPEDRDYRVIGLKDGKPAVVYAGDGQKSCIRWVLENGDRMKSLMFKWGVRR